MVVEFKYDVGQKIFYDNEMWSVVAQKVLKTKNITVLSYNLRKVASHTEYINDVWESEISTLQIIK